MVELNLPKSVANPRTEVSERSWRLRQAKITVLSRPDTASVPRPLFQASVVRATNNFCDGVLKVSQTLGAPSILTVLLDLHRNQCPKNSSRNPCLERLSIHSPSSEASQGTSMVAGFPHPSTNCEQRDYSRRHIGRRGINRRILLSAILWPIGP